MLLPNVGNAAGMSSRTSIVTISGDLTYYQPGAFSVLVDHVIVIMGSVKRNLKAPLGVAVGSSIVCIATAFLTDIH
jgi:hypothetical protein